MAVYTNITKENLSLLLKEYNIGNLINYEAILEGVENTNYKIVTTQNTYILTIFEKRVKKNDLPFFMRFMRFFLYPDLELGLQGLKTVCERY